MKPGYQTTEFWSVVISYVLGFFVMGGTITQQQANDLIQPIAQIAVAIVIIVAQVYYLKSRTVLKKALIENGQPVAPAPTQTVEQNPLLEQPITLGGPGPSQQPSVETNPLL